MLKKAIILISFSSQQKFLNKMESLSIKNIEFHFANSLIELEELFFRLEKVTILFSFGTSIIVPEKFLFIKDCRAVNIHAASPQFPGRDPHHFAIYENVKNYGATLHYMTSKVDSGSIIDLELFDIDKEYTPIQLLEAANECAWKLLSRFFTWISNDIKLPESDQVWSGKTRTRKDFQKLCKIEPQISSVELERRIKAFSVENYHNLYTEIHGKKFYLH
jgi:methionyl-tRNA formyltransferase